MIGILLGVGVSALYSKMIKQSEWQLPQSQIVVRGDYGDFAYDGRTHEPIWTLEVLSPFDASQITETDIPKTIQSELSDYKDSGFAIGRLLMGPGKEYASATSPQVPQFNKVYWAKFENHARELVKKLNLNRVAFFTGPLYLPHDEKDGKKYVTYQVIGKNDVAVPTHFFKVISAGEGRDLQQWAYIVPNEPIDSHIPFDTFVTTVEKIEKVSGIIFNKNR